ncbi:hypothetical protein GCM10009869_04430 [Amnibacterium kyonggiense]
MRQSVGALRPCRKAEMPEKSDEMIAPFIRYLRRVPMDPGLYWTSGERGLGVRWTVPASPDPGPPVLTDRAVR